MTSRQTVLFALCILTIWTIHTFGLIGYTSYTTGVKNWTASAIDYEDESSLVPYNETTCSQRSHRRGKGQRVFAFSFYGGVTSNLSKVRGYFDGIRDNLEIVTKRYPNYVMRVYIDVGSEHPILSELKDLQEANLNFDICDVNALPGNRLANAPKMFPMVWRFFPTLDSQVFLAK